MKAMPLSSSSHGCELDFLDITLTKHEYWHRRMEIQSWCQENFGLSVIDWAVGRWKVKEVFGNGKFFFTNEQDALLFKLTWCGT